MITNDEHYYNPELALSGTTDEDFVIYMKAKPSEETKKWFGFLP